MALQVAHHVLLSHGMAVPIVREHGDRDTQVGITLNYSPAWPASDTPEDVAAARRHDGYANRWFMDPLYKGAYPEDMWKLFDYQVPRVAPGDMEIIARETDFLGVNYYNRAVIQHQEGEFLDYGSIHPEGEYTAMDWEVYPPGIENLLVRLAEDYDSPVMYITENGCAYEDVVTDDGEIHDVKRIDYLRGHLAAANRAIKRGVRLKGYFLWSLLDNFEWAFGYSRRFGIVHVDFTTQKRTLKDSAKYYASVIAANAVEA